MLTDDLSTARRLNDSGVSILIIAVSMVFILGMAGLAIDLASLYVARSQAQRAADAAALAGAEALVNQGCVTGTTGTGLTSTCMAFARQNAETVGNQNMIAGENPDITDSDIHFPNKTSSDPQIQVTAGRSVPTFFMKIFGITQASISAVAKAEAYNPSGSTTNIGTACLKPWLFPNCDEFNGTSAPNPDCDQSAGYNGGSVGPFVNSDGKVVRPEQYPNGALGEPYAIKPGSTGSAAAPGQFYAAYVPNADSVPSECPACAGTPTTSGSQESGALYQANIECCNTSPMYCGETLSTDSSAQATIINDVNGNMVGPTEHGVDCLINQGNNCGQDFIPSSDLNASSGGASLINNPCADPTKKQGAVGLPQLLTVPPTIMPGANNLNDPSGKNAIVPSSSNSVVVAPIYNGIITSGQSSVTITGFVQLFIRDYAQNQQGTVYAYVIGISGCGSGTTTTGTTGSSGAVTSSYGSTVPVRLIN